MPLPIAFSTQNECTLAYEQKRNNYRRPLRIVDNKARGAFLDDTPTSLSSDKVKSISNLMDSMTQDETPSIEAVDPTTMKSAAACDWNPRQHRYDLLGAGCRLATAALLPPLAHEALSLGCELDCSIQESESREAQTQKLTQSIRRQFISLHGRRRFRLARVIPLTCLHSICLCPAYQTCVRIFDRCGLIPSSAIRR